MDKLEVLNEKESTFVIGEYQLKRIKVRNIIMQLLEVSGGEISFDDYCLVQEHIKFIDMGLGETLAAVVRNRRRVHEKND
jgi:hypothetical protein